jgi:transposase-like protein
MRIVFPKAIEVLEDGLEDSLSFYAFPELDARKTASTNMLERLNKEIRRRTNVVGIFPNPDSYLRLVTTYLMEYAEDWFGFQGVSESAIHTDIAAKSGLIHFRSPQIANFS